MNMAPQMLALAQSFIVSVMIIYPLMLLARGAWRKMAPSYMQLYRMSDDIIRSLALGVFLLMLTVLGIVMFHWDNWYGILGPIEVFLFLIFAPLYKKMN